MIDNKKERISAWNATAYNERFCVIAAVSPQIMQWELASYCPAGSSVEAATTQSRHHVNYLMFCVKRTYKLFVFKILNEFL